MAKATTYQVVFEGGATAFVKAFSFTVEDDKVIFRSQEGEPLEDHYFKPNTIQAVIPDSEGKGSSKAGFI